MTTIAVSHKIRLTPSRQQEDYFLRACGTARFTYNWGLAKWKELYVAGGKPSAFMLKKMFNECKKTDYPWVADVTKCAPEQAFNDLQASFRNFFSKNAKFPAFKKKGKSKDSFYLSNDQFEVRDKKVRIPKLGWVKMREALRFSGKILAARVSRTADHWYLAIQVEIPKPAETTKNHDGVGVDLGLNSFAYTSDGQSFDAPKPLRSSLRKLRRLQRRHSRRARGSNNRKKSARKIARLHERIGNIRLDFLHKLTTFLSCQYELVAIEDLNVRGMVRNRRLARSISDVSWGEFRRQLEYKKSWYGGAVYVVDRFFPSSKTCCVCGWKKKDLTLADREFVCDHCGHVLNRDWNAAVNILNQSTGGLPGSYACGQTDHWPAVVLAG